MANNYRQFAFCLKLRNKEEADWFVKTLKEASEKEDEDGETCTDFDWDVGIEENFNVYFRDNGEFGNVEQIADFVEKYLKHFEVPGHFRISWADTCSKHRIDEFGGGFAVVTAEGTHWFNETEWLSEKISSINLEKRLNE